VREVLRAVLVLPILAEGVAEQKIIVAVQAVAVS
jgi:hypothetical protein